MATGNRVLRLAFILLLFVSAALCDGRRHGDSHDHDDDHESDSRHADDKFPEEDCEEDDRNGHNRGAVVVMFVACGIAAIAATFIITICIIKRMKLKKARVMSTDKLNIYTNPCHVTEATAPEKNDPLPPPYVPHEFPATNNQPPHYLAVDISKMDMPPPYEKVPDTKGLYDKTSLSTVYP